MLSHRAEGKCGGRYDLISLHVGDRGVRMTETACDADDIPSIHEEMRRVRVAKVMDVETGQPVANCFRRLSELLDDQIDIPQRVRRCERSSHFAGEDEIQGAPGIAHCLSAECLPIV